MDKKQLGKYGENLAQKWLKDNGYKIIEINKTIILNSKKFAEIDILASKLINNQLRHFLIEVKTRRTFKYGSASLAITSQKLQRIYTLIESLDKFYPSLIPALIAIDIINSQPKITFSILY
jgi:putative endonuclease